MWGETCTLVQSIRLLLCESSNKKDDHITCLSVLISHSHNARFSFPRWTNSTPSNLRQDSQCFRYDIVIVFRSYLPSVFHQFIVGEKHICAQTFCTLRPLACHMGMVFIFDQCAWRTWRRTRATWMTASCYSLLFSVRSRLIHILLEVVPMNPETYVRCVLLFERLRHVHWPIQCYVLIWCRIVCSVMCHVCITIMGQWQQRRHRRNVCDKKDTVFVVLAWQKSIIDCRLSLRLSNDLKPI